MAATVHIKRRHKEEHCQTSGYKSLSPQQEHPHRSNLASNEYSCAASTFHVLLLTTQLNFEQPLEEGSYMITLHSGAGGVRHVAATVRGSPVMVIPHTTHAHKIVCI
jgi:hypothetical protein